MSQVWQSPYVNIFKHFNLKNSTNSTKEGDVSCIMDKAVKGSVWKIVGSVPATNYLALPRDNAVQSLSLQGRFLTLLFRPLPQRYFVVHYDVLTVDGFVVRVSFSNLFKEFKATATWLQFPYVCRRSCLVDKNTKLSKGDIGAAPVATKWTQLTLDLQHLLSLYLNRRYASLKSVRLCANLLVKNIYTSDNEFEPGMNYNDMKRSGLNNVSPVPRELSLPVPKGRNWDDVYDYILFPVNSSNKCKPFDSIQKVEKKTKTDKNEDPYLSPRRIEAVSPSKVIKGKVLKKSLVQEIPNDLQLPVVTATQGRATEAEVHVYPQKSAAYGGDATIRRECERTRNSGCTRTRDSGCERTRDTGCERTRDSGCERTRDSECTRTSVKMATVETRLEPDPLIRLRKVIGFSGGLALWDRSASEVVYACQSLVVAMTYIGRKQRFFIGHTDKISAFCMNENSTILASGQTGNQAIVRIWKFSSATCLALFKTHAHSLYTLSLSPSGSHLVGVGKDKFSKNLVVMWSLQKIQTNKQVSVLAKAHTDCDIANMVISHFDDTRLLSCGRDNVRLWRLKKTTLKSAPVDLQTYHSGLVFTDCCFHPCATSNDSENSTVYACTLSGHIFEIDMNSMSLVHVRRLVPTSNLKEQAISINRLVVAPSFCATGSDDGYLRLWPSDFRSVLLEAEHDGPLNALQISMDGTKVLAGTSKGSLGVLDLTTSSYDTLARGHTDHINDFAVDNVRRHLVTASRDGNLCVWNLDTLQQGYDFSTTNKDEPLSVCYHPTSQVFACGFSSGTVRFFNVGTTSLLAEYRQHKKSVSGIVFTPNGEFFLSCGQDGSLALYDSCNSQLKMLRLLVGQVCQEIKRTAIAVSQNSKLLAVIGPTVHTVAIMDCGSLQELLRIDVGSTRNWDNDLNEQASIVNFAHFDCHQLMVATATGNLLKFNVHTGKLDAQENNLHPDPVTCLTTSLDGIHLATASSRGHLSVWRYAFDLTHNRQTFLAHSTGEPISRLEFTSDSLSLITAGDALYIWDYLAIPHVNASFCNEEFFKDDINIARQDDIELRPRGHAPVATTFDPMNSITNIGDIVLDDLLSDEEEPGQCETVALNLQHNRRVICPSESHQHHDLSTTPPSLSTPPVGELEYYCATTAAPTEAPADARVDGKHQRCESPDIIEEPSTPFAHFHQKNRKYSSSKRRYTAPPGAEGLSLKSTIGYNGNGRGNMFWHSKSSLFLFSSGSLLILEDLATSKQRHLIGHPEEISTISLSNNSKTIASASGAREMSECEIRLWNVDCEFEESTSIATLLYHEFDVQSMSFNADDSLLISIGNYKDSSLAVWCTKSNQLLTHAKLDSIVHNVVCDPSHIREFVTSGSKLCFWYVDIGPSNTASPTAATPTRSLVGKVELKVQRAKLPDDIQDECTSAHYHDSLPLVFFVTSRGSCFLFNTSDNTCLQHRQIVKDFEIVTVHFAGNKLLTTSVDCQIRLWTCDSEKEIDSLTSSKPQILELDDKPVSSCFDDQLAMGIVGTQSGTLWYVNTEDTSKICIVSSAGLKINDIALFGNHYMATGGEDGAISIWETENREKILQFNVSDQSCNCIAFSPSSSTDPSLIAAGFCDGSLRLYDIHNMEMTLKITAHSTAITAIAYSNDGHLLLSADSQGIVIITSVLTGICIKQISDHKGAVVTSLQVSPHEYSDASNNTRERWLAVSADRRVSVWTADRSHDICTLTDWLTFAGPLFTPSGTGISSHDACYPQMGPPTLAKFSPIEHDIILYTGYSLTKKICIYSMTQKKVIRTIEVTDWLTSLDVTCNRSLICAANQQCLLKLYDYYSSTFQDYDLHNDNVVCSKFTDDGSLLISATDKQLFIWTVNQ